jgi:tRNA-splicing ligase RtcB
LFPTTLEERTMTKQHKIYSDAIDGKALAQFFSALGQPWAVKGALMPDAHAGYSLPIGAVVATEGVVVPAWVGFDIGCGMLAVETTFDAEAVRGKAKEIFNGIYRDVPVGFAHNAKASQWVAGEALPRSQALQGILDRKGMADLHSLGGGNHFIEIGVDENDRVWIVIHSGSRNLGHSAATHYMKLAAGDGKAREGHYVLDVKSEGGRDYLGDLAFCLEYALENRRGMVARIEKAVSRQVCHGKVVWEALINRNHNHAEEKDGVWIHRKGATHAEAGMMGVIPGNMRDGSFIVRGKGNPDALCSSSHGAGRVMGRKEAKEKLDMAIFRQEMEDRGIQARVESSTLDESASAYKDIFEVMAMQRDLVEVLHHIKPIINIKG